jgi:hypothetical protein
MPFGAVAGGLAAGIGGAVVSSALSPGTSGGSGGGGGNFYVPTGLVTADQSWQQLLAQELGTQGALTQQNPLYLQALQSGLASQNQYGAGAQQYANMASGQYANLGSQLQGAAGLDFGAQQGLLNAGQQVFNMGLDPQSALYDRTLNQVTQQTGATNSMYGLGSSAAGAGVQNQALSNFNIDWQNNQLSRALQGLQGYGQAAGQAGQLAGQGATLGQAGAGATYEAGQLPYQTAMGLSAAPGQLAATYQQQLEQGPLSSASAINSQIIPYLNYGNGAQSVPFQAQSAGAGAAGSLVSNAIQGIGNNTQVQNAFSNLFNPASGSFSGGDFSGAFNSSPYYSGGGNSYGFTLQ